MLPVHRKVLQMAAGLKADVPVVLLGPSGSGKSTCCRVLSLAMNLLYKRISPGSMFSDDNLSTNHTGVSRRSQKLQVCMAYSYLTSGASVK